MHLIFHNFAFQYPIYNSYFVFSLQLWFICLCLNTVILYIFEMLPNIKQLDYLFLLSLTSTTFSLTSTLFKRTRNISTTSWSSALQQSSLSSSLIECAFLCVHRENKDGVCNAFQYDVSLGNCQTALVGLGFYISI